MVFVEHPSAISHASEFLIALSVTISRGSVFSLTSFIICIPLCFAKRMRCESTAGIVPLPGSARPRISVMQFIELAVNIPAHEPQPGHAPSAISSALPELIFPESTAAGASKASVSAMRFPSIHPGSMGPPEQKIDGIFSRKAAISIPGTILSQFGINTSPSNGCAIAIISTESAICSRLGRE